MEQITFGLIWYIAFLFSTTCHEAAHVFAALKLGDPTAYHEGQVSLNPIPHVRREPLGTVLVPLLSFFAGGWMLGWASAPYDPYWAERYPKPLFVSAPGGGRCGSWPHLCRQCWQWTGSTGSITPWSATGSCAGRTSRSPWRSTSFAVSFGTIRGR